MVKYRDGKRVWLDRAMPDKAFVYDDIQWWYRSWSEAELTWVLDTLETVTVAVPDDAPGVSSADGTKTPATRQGIVFACMGNMMMRWWI